MAMRPIKFPGGRDLDRSGTIQVNDTLAIEFDDGGYFSHNNDLAFNPDLPTGYFEADSNVNTGSASTIGQKVKLSFLDAKDHQLYKYTLTIVK